METMHLGWVSLLSFLLGGGGNDFLNYIPTKTYWEIQSVEMSPRNMLAEIKPVEIADVTALIDELSSPDAAVRKNAARKIAAMGPGALPDLRKAAESPDAETAQTARGLIVQITREARPRSIRRLMAIRTLGEMKEKDAAAPLKPLLDSEEPFVAEYAQRALAQIEGKEFDPQRPRDLVQGDLWLLPEQCAAVGQIIPSGKLAVRIDEAISDWKLPGDEPLAQRTRDVSEMMLQTIHASGNMRIDSVTSGVSGDISDHSGFVVALVRGEFDPDSLKDVMRGEHSASSKVEGVEVFYSGPELAMFLVSRNLMVVLAAPQQENLPLQQMIAATRNKKAGLRNNVELVKLIESADRNQPGWAVARITPAMRTSPILAGLNTLSLNVTERPQTVDLKVLASGSDAAAVEKSAGAARSALAEVRNEVSRLASFMPPLKPLQECFNGAQIKASGKDLTATATFEGPLTPLLVFSIMPFTAPLQGAANGPADGAFAE